MFGIINTALTIGFYLFGLTFMGVILIGMLILHPVESLIELAIFYLLIWQAVDSLVQAPVERPVVVAWVASM